MSQRTSQGSVTEFLECNAEDLQPPKVEQYKRTTVGDLSTDVFLGWRTYHRYRPSGIPGCPNADWDLEEGTIEDAIEQLLRPCKACCPPDYRPGDDTKADTDGDER